MIVEIQSRYMPALRNSGIPHQVLDLPTKKQMVNKIEACRCDDDPERATSQVEEVFTDLMKSAGYTDALRHLETLKRW